MHIKLKAGHGIGPRSAFVMGVLRMAALLVILIMSAVIWKSCFQQQGAWQTTSSSSTVDLMDGTKCVALTFDDGPHPVYTEQVLDVLEKQQVHATFFLMGKEVECYPQIVKRMHDEGHLIGNHTYSHIDICQTSCQEALQEVTRTNDLIYDICQEPVEWFRAPYGCASDSLEQKTQMIWVTWDVDPLDWSCQNADQIVNHIVKNVSENDIILMHDAYPSTVEATERIIVQLREMGYTFVTVEQLMMP